MSLVEVKNPIPPNHFGEPTVALIIPSALEKKLFMKYS